MSSLSSPKPWRSESCGGITEVLDSQEFGKGKVAKIVRITHELDVAFRRRIDVNHTNDENFSRTARLRILGEWLPVLDGCDLVLA